MRLGDRTRTLRTLGAGEMGVRLEHLLLLQKTSVGFPAPMSGGSKPPVTPAPVYSDTLYPHTYTQQHRHDIHTQTHKL